MSPCNCINHNGQIKKPFKTSLNETIHETCGSRTLEQVMNKLRNYVYIYSFLYEHNVYKHI